MVVGQAILWTCLFLLLVMATEAAASRWRIPAAAWMLAWGLLYGVSRKVWEGILPELPLKPDVIIFVFLPLLVFGSARRLRRRSLRATALPVALLGLGGPLLATVILGVPLALVGGWGGGTALLFATALSATDPMAVGALLGKRRAPDKLKTIIEGESLASDGVVVILFSSLAGAVVEGANLNIPLAGGALLYAVFGAVVLGIAAGAAGGWLLRTWKYAHDRFIGALFPLVLVYLVFILAHSLLHLSGVVAVVAATLVFNTMHSHCSQPTIAQQRSDQFFADFRDFLGTLATAALFFGVGALVGQHRWLLPWILLPVACIALLCSRLATVYPLRALHRIAGSRLPLPWLHVLAASGLRGALSVALLMSLPTSYEHRMDMLCLCFALILFSLIAFLTTDRLLLTDMELDSHSETEKEIPYGRQA